MKELNVITKSCLLVVVLTLALTLLVSATNVSAQCMECTTNVSGIISGQTWTKAGSPYCVEGDVTVIDLTIQPGVNVCLLGNYVFEVQGDLDAIGTDLEPIVFTRHVDNTEGWQGIFFNFSTSGSQLRYCEIDGSINSGLRSVESLFSIEKCTIQGNTAFQGGGINIFMGVEGDELIVKDCVIQNNTSSNHAGGIRADIQAGTLQLLGCTIENNTSNPAQANGNFVGGGIFATVGATSDLLLSDCKIIGNTTRSDCQSCNCSATGRGGGIFKNGDGPVALERCIVSNNLNYVTDSYHCTENGYSYGGGIYIDGGESEVASCVINNNEALSVANRKYGYGGGIYLNSGTLNLTNCTIRGNYSSLDGGGLGNASGTMTVINSILFFNTIGTGEYFQIYGDATVTYSSVHGCPPYEGEGNICDNPLFENDYRLSAISPCIDAGSNDAPLLPPSDIDGEPRIMDGDGDGVAVVDMGAYEFPGGGVGCIVDCATDESGALNILETCGSSGNLTTVTVEMNDAPNAVDALGFDVMYDSGCLNYTNIFERGDLTAGFDFFDCALESPGVVRCGGFDADPNAIPQGASGSIVSLNFAVTTPNLDDPTEAVELGLQALVDKIVGWSTSPGYICPCCSCDVSGEGTITPQDALCAFQKYLGICPTSCGPCENICCDVNGDGQCTPADALCIFQKYLGIGCEHCWNVPL